MIYILYSFFNVIITCTFIKNRGRLREEEFMNVGDVIFTIIELSIELYIIYILFYG